MARAYGFSFTADTLTVQKKGTASGKIKWSLPNLPSGAKITACTLEGSYNTISNVTVTVNGETLNSSPFSINLGTSNTITSVDTVATSKGSGAGTITFSSLVYAVDYVLEYTVTFVDWDGTVLKTQTLAEGASATAPSNPTRNGYKFIGWDVDFSNVTSNLTVTAQYEEIIYYTVTFKDYDETVLKTEQVEQGKSATAPTNPTRDGYKFTGWDVSFNNITSNLTITAQYEEIQLIEWTGIGTIATELKAHAGDDGYSHDNYKINLDWENESFDIIITGELNRSSSYFYNLGQIGNVKIGDAKFTILFSDGYINIYYGGTNALEYYNSDSDYGYFPFVVSFTKNGIYVKSSTNTGEYSTPEFLSGSENIYEINQPIYLIDDGLIHSSVSNQENPKYNIIFNLAVSEYSEQTEEPGLTEPVDGYIAKNLVSHGDWSYTFNVDWDTQYLDIEVLNYEHGFFRTEYYYGISNNSYDESYSHESVDDFIIHGVAVESGRTDIDIIRYSKVDGVCIITSNGTQIIPGNSFANDNKMTIKAVIPTEWFLEEDGFMTFNIKITDITPSEEPEDIIEWTGIGTVATGLNSGIKHSNYKINLDWDNEYFDIILQDYTYTGNGVATANVCNVQINNNTYEYCFYEGSIALCQGPINVYEWTPNVIPHTLRFAKDGIYCLYEEENVKIGEIEYNDNAIYILEDDEYDTDFSMNFDLVVSERPSEEPEEDVIEWTGLGTIATNLSTEDDWTYKLNIDWDTQYVEINNIAPGVVAFNHGADVLYLNNEYDFSTGDLIYCDETGMLIINSKNDYRFDFWAEDFFIKISKDNGFTLTNYYNGESFTIENYPIIENSSTLYLSSLVRLEDGYSTIGEIKVVELENPEEPDNNELVQGDINDETGAFEDETPNIVKTKYIDISDKKQIMVNVLTEDVYILKCYLYNANKELVKVIDISADKKRMFGLDLQKLISEVINDGNK